MAFALITATTVFRGFYVMEYQLRPQLRERNPTHCSRLMREMWTLALVCKSALLCQLRRTHANKRDKIAIITFVGGFFIWNMDNIFCKHLTTAKNQLQLPWSIVLEGHGWWHILTGLGGKCIPTVLSIMVIR